MDQGPGRRAVYENASDLFGGLCKDEATGCKFGFRFKCRRNTLTLDLLHGFGGETTICIIAFRGVLRPHPFRLERKKKTVRQYLSFRVQDEYGGWSHGMQSVEARNLSSARRPKKGERIIPHLLNSYSYITPIPRASISRRSFGFRFPISPRGIRLVSLRECSSPYPMNSTLLAGSK